MSKDFHKGFTGQPIDHGNRDQVAGKITRDNIQQRNEDHQNFNPQDNLNSDWSGKPIISTIIGIILFIVGYSARSDGVNATPIFIIASIFIFFGLLGLFVNQKQD